MRASLFKLLAVFATRTASVFITRTVSVPATAARTGVKLIDALLTRLYKIQTFSEKPDCILRVSHSRASRAAALPDGTRIRPGDEIVEIHFWNERLSSLGGGSSGEAEPVTDLGLARGAGFISRLMGSLRQLAEWVEQNPAWGRFVAVHGTLGFIPAAQVEALKPRARRLGFALELRETPRLRFWTAAFWAQLWAWWLLWAYNPASRRGKRLRDMALVDFWMSRRALLSLRAAGPCPVSKPPVTA